MVHLVLNFHLTLKIRSRYTHIHTHNNISQFCHVFPFWKSSTFLDVLEKDQSTPRRVAPRPSQKGKKSRSSPAQHHVDTEAPAPQWTTSSLDGRQHKHQSQHQLCRHIDNVISACYGPLGYEPINHGNILGVLRNSSIFQLLLRMRLTSNIIHNAPNVFCGGTDRLTITHTSLNAADFREGLLSR